MFLFDMIFKYAKFTSYDEDNNPLMVDEPKIDPLEDSLKKHNFGLIKDSKTSEVKQVLAPSPEEMIKHDEH